MRSSRNGRLGISLLVVIVALVMIGGIAFLAQSIFGGASNKPMAGNSQVKLLTEPTDNTVVTMTVRGPITAKEKHYDITVELSSTQRKLVIYKGYNKIEESKKIELDNDSQAFRDFLLALNQAGFVNKLADDVAKDNGMCANGQIINFAIRQGDQAKYDAWTTSCGDVTGDFAGNNAQVIDLIVGQIPGAKAAIASAQTY